MSSSGSQFLDSTSDHDRVLVVDEKKFYVKEELLTKHSDYFAAMFSGNFAEKDKKEIPLKGIDAYDFEDFLVAISNPRKYSGTMGKLFALMKTCSYLSAVPTLMEILSMEIIIRRFSYRENATMLLKQSRDCGIYEIINRVESLWIDRLDIVSLKLAVQYKMEKLLDLIEKLYLDSKTTPNLDQYSITLSLLNEYNLGKNEYCSTRLENFENLYVQKLTASKNKIDLVEHLEVVKTWNLKIVENAISVILIDYIEAKKVNGKFDFSTLCDALSLSMKISKIEVYLSEYLIEDFQTNYTIENIELLISERFGRWIANNELPTFKKFLANTFFGRSPIDPLFTTNKESFDRLSSGAKLMIFDLMRNEP